jgi:lysophospholipase L1-like esterase
LPAQARRGPIALIAVLLGLALPVAADRVAGLFLGPSTRIPLGLLPSARARIETSEFAFELRTNRLGIRDDELAVPRTRRSLPRVLVLGDSFTFGWGVEHSEVWTERVEAALRARGPGVEMVNLGRPGAGPVDYADFAEQAISLLDPDLVMVAFFQGDDLAQSDRAQRHRMPIVTMGPAVDRVVRLFATLLPNGARLLVERIEPNVGAERVRQVMRAQARRLAESFRGPERARYEALDAGLRARYLAGDLNPYLLMLAVREPDRFLPSVSVDHPVTRRHIRNVTAQLRRIRACSGSRPLLVVSIPAPIYVNAEDYASAERLGFRLDTRMLVNDDADEAIRLAAAAVGLQTWTCTRELRGAASARRLYFPVDGHFNAEGHRLYADWVAPLVEIRAQGFPGVPTASP